MKHIYLNLKRFDVPVRLGGVNRIADIKDWASYIIENTQDALYKYDPNEIEFAMYFPEAHLLAAIAAREKNSKAVPGGHDENGSHDKHSGYGEDGSCVKLDGQDEDGCRIKLGCQGVYREDVAVGGNFGAFTTNRPAAAMAAVGCDTVLIGHCEERNDKAGILAEAGVVDNDAVNKILNKEIKCAINQGMTVLYCIGEKSEEQEQWMEVLSKQLEIGLADVDKSKVVIAYEPVWSIGPGKTPADKEYITKIARFVKEKTAGMVIVYGGGLKQENAEMLASIDEIDGGLIALTRFRGEIGFYPEEYLEIIRLYLGK